MPCFNTGKTFLLPSFDLEVKEQKAVERFLALLDDSGVGKVIDRYIRNNTPRALSRRRLRSRAGSASRRKAAN